MTYIHKCGLYYLFNGKPGIFDNVRDPRIPARCLHKLSDLLFIALCTLLSNGEDSIDMVSFAVGTRGIVRQVIEFPNGIPSDDTCGSVLQIVDPESLGKILVDKEHDFFRHI